MVRQHAISLAGLIPDSTYHYRVRSRNSAGLEGAATGFTFRSNPAGVVNDIIVEARLSDGSLNSNPPYSDNSSFNNSTLKSSAAGLTGTGSRYAISGTPSFTVRPPLPVPGASYDVYVTQGNASSISDDLVVAVGQSGCTGLPATTTIFRESGGNTWEYLGRMKLTAGVTVPTLTFTYSSGTLMVGYRMYSDATRYVYVPPPPVTNPPQMTTIGVLPDGRTKLALTCETGVPCVIEVSSNLAIWSPAMSVLRYERYGGSN